MNVNIQRCLLFGAAICAASAAPAFAVTLDGSRAGDAYTLRATQTVETQFGDNESELNAAYTEISGGFLNLMLTGNIQNNFNKLNIFIDSVPGGENTLTADINNGGNNPTNDNWANNYAGFTFDTGFEADYMFINRNGSFGGDRFDFDFSSVGSAAVVEASGDIFGGTFAGSNPSVGASGIGVGFDNSNMAGVLGGTAAAVAANAQAVLTGLELSIPLAAIGNPDINDIKIVAMIGNGDNNFASNQFLGGLQAPQGNLGGDGGGNFTGNLSGIDLRQFAGNQFFLAVPEPSSISLLGLMAAGLLFLGRRRS